MFFFNNFEVVYVRLFFVRKVKYYNKALLLNISGKIVLGGKYYKRK